MRKIFLPTLASVVLSFGFYISFAPGLLAGGADEHFEIRQAGGAGAVIPNVPAPGAPMVFDASPIPPESIQAPEPVQEAPQFIEPEAAEAEGGSAEGGWRSLLPRPRAPEDEEAFQARFSWWPSDAKPAPVRDLERGGYWWWPSIPGEARPWGNRGYIYVRKIIFDYKEVPTTSLEQLKPSLVVKKILNNVKIYFDFDKADIREDTTPILDKAVRILKKHPEADILITGHADTRGSEDYNLELGERRAEVVRQYILSKTIAPERIRILSRGKLDALAPVTDIVGMQIDRNAQFMVAEVVEVMIPESQRYLYEDVPEEPEIEEIESAIRVGFREYTIQEGDTLGKLAKEVYGSALKWEYIFNFNQDVIENPHKLTVGTVIRIPQE